MIGTSVPVGLAVATRDGRAWTWTLGTVGLREVGKVPRLSGVLSVDYLDADRVRVLDRGYRAWHVTGGHATLPCGERRSAAHLGEQIVIDAAGGAVLCDLTTGASRPLPQALHPTSTAMSGDRTRAAFVHDRGRVAVIRLGDLGEDPFPPVADAIGVQLDHDGDRAVVLTRAGVVAIERGAVAPIVLAGAGDPGRTVVAIAPGGRWIAAISDRRVVAWEVDRPARPHLLGTLSVPISIAVRAEDDGSVMTVGTGIDQRPGEPAGAGATAAIWPPAPPDLEAVRRWIGLVAP